MIPMNRVLVPTDFSELATRGLEYAMDLARNYKAELHVLHVVAPSRQAPAAIGTGLVEGAGAMMIIETAEQVAARRADELRAHVHDRSGGLLVPPQTEVRIGAIWEQIARYADEARIDLIVIGTHARSLLQRILLGSTSKAVLEHASCPVLMVPIAAVNRPETSAAESAEPRAVDARST